MDASDEAASKAADASNAARKAAETSQIQETNAQAAARIVSKILTFPPMVALILAGVATAGGAASTVPGTSPSPTLSPPSSRPSRRRTVHWCSSRWARSSNPRCANADALGGALPRHQIRAVVARRRRRRGLRARVPGRRAIRPRRSRPRARAVRVRPVRPRPRHGRATRRMPHELFPGAVPRRGVCSGTGVQRHRRRRDHRGLGHARGSRGGGRRHRRRRIPRRPRFSAGQDDLQAHRANRARAKLAISKPDGGRRTRAEREPSRRPRRCHRELETEGGR